MMLFFVAIFILIKLLTSVRKDFYQFVTVGIMTVVLFVIQVIVSMQ